MALTLDQVRALMYGNDDIDPIAEDSSEVTDNGNELLFSGTNTSGDEVGKYRDHLRMVAEGHGVRLFSKQLDIDEWDEQPVFYNFEDLHTWIYEM